MNDPVAQKNEKRIPPAHRIADIRMSGESAFVECSCGWANHLGGETEPEHIELAWNEHRREYVTRSHR